MVMEKTCPGSIKIREPKPEIMKCSVCGSEVEIWTDELKATCKCGGKVFRAQQVSCIDWCPHAKECVGPEVYARLRPFADEDVSAANSPLAMLEREHTRALEALDLLRGAALCLKLAVLKPGTPIQEKGIEHLTKVLDFFQRDLELHFRREEEVIFPVLGKYLNQEKSPARVLIQEHEEVWQYYDRLSQKLAELKASGNEHIEFHGQVVEEISDKLERLLKEHIKKENDSLFPIFIRLVPAAELDAIPQKLRAIQAERPAGRSRK